MPFTRRLRIAAQYVARWVAVASLAAWGTAGIAAPADEPLPNPVLVPGAPWAFEGFSINAPEGEDWASFSKDARSAELGKKFDDGRTAAVVVTSVRFDDSIVREDDLLRWMRRELSALPDPAATKLLEYAQEAYSPKGALCARSSARFDDRRPEQVAPGVLVVRGIACVRPDRPEVVITLRVAERLPGVDRAPGLGEVATRLFDSLRFVPPAGAEFARAREAVADKRGEDAVRLLQPAADEGDSEAALFLGNLYLYGTGLPADAERARHYLELAANGGRTDALYNLGAIYDKAIGVPRDPAMAMKWFTRAADQRDAQAQLNLALFYLHGDGVPKDVRTAEQWLRRAAGNGSKRAKALLASGQLKTR